MGKSHDCGNFIVVLQACRHRIRVHGEEARLRKLYCCATGVPTSHSSSEGRVHGMARPGRPTATLATTVKPALKVSVPHCIEPTSEAAWWNLQDVLWAGKADPATNSTRITREQGAAIEAMLRPEVAAAL